MSRDHRKIDKSGDSERKANKTLMRSAIDASGSLRSGTLDSALA